jgi:hypothetical protein
MLGAAELLARRGEKQYPAKLLSLAAQHEASTYDTKEKACRLLEEVALAGPRDASPTFHSSSQALNWQAIAGQTIEMLASHNG